MGQNAKQGHLYCHKLRGAPDNSRPKEIQHLIKPPTGGRRGGGEGSKMKNIKHRNERLGAGMCLCNSETVYCF